MIYEYPDPSEPIQQGDIFINIPRVDISLNKILLAEEYDTILTKWSEISQQKDTVNIIATARPVIAIVATQNCDATRARDLTLFEIDRFQNVEKKANDKTGAKGWKNIITQHARLNLKWFYLPPDEKEIKEKMAVNFMTAIRISRIELNEIIQFRIARLNKIAYDHFRERISDFFRRYAYDEWYPLNNEELDIYRQEYSEIIPFEWQTKPDPES